MFGGPSVHHPQWLSPVDAAWFGMERSRSPADIIALLGFEGRVDQSRLRELIATRLIAVQPRFSQRVVSAGLHVTPPHWEKEPNPELSQHFTSCRLPAPGGDAELIALIDRLTNQAFDFTRSPWRSWLIEGHREGSILLAQLHHCMGDGFALLDLLLSLADEPPVRLAPAQTPLPRGRMRALFRAARRVRRGVGDLSHLAFLPFDPATRLRGVPSGERGLAWSSPIELSRIKLLAHAHHATINDLLTAVLAGALRTYLLEHGDAPQPLRAMVPVNLRPSGAPIDATQGNRFGLLFVDLPTAIADREQRLWCVKQSIDRIKASEEPVVSLALLAVLGRLPGPVAGGVEQIFRRKTSLVVSNVPGPLELMSLAGQRVRDIMFWVPHPVGLACGVSFLSYAGKLRVGVRSDKRVLSDPARIAALLERELQAFGAA